MLIDEKDLIPVKGKELFPGAIVYVKEGNEFLKIEIDLAWYPSDRLKNEFRAKITELSAAGKLFRRRDKPFQDFRDLL